MISTFSYLWTSTAVDAIDELVGHGHTAFEIPISSPHCWPDEMSDADVASAKARLRDRGATVGSLNAGGYDINLASPGANMRAKSIEQIAAVIDLAAAWEVPEVVISPGTRRPMISPPLEATYGWSVESLRTLVPLAEAAGVRLLLENTPYCFVPTVAELAGLVDSVDDDAVKIVFDIANAAYIEDDPVAGLLAHHESIAFVHISDTGVETWGHDPIGTGVVDFRGLGQAVEKTCGTDNVVLEIIREQNPLQEFDQAVRDLTALGWAL